MALTDKLTAIGVAIRAKTGKSDLLTLDQMPLEIASITTGGGVPEEAFSITGSCQYRFANGGWDWFIRDYGNQVTTSNITHCGYMFFNSGVNEIPFDINGSNVKNLSYMFYGNAGLRKAPKIRGVAFDTSFTGSSFFYENGQLRDIEDLFSADEFEAFKNVKVTSQYSSPQAIRLSGLRSLRTVPSWFCKQVVSEESTAYPSASYTLYNSAFQNCISLDEAINLPVLRCNAAQTSNMFNSMFYYCNRLKNVTFETNPDGTPFVVQWKSQKIDLTTKVGWAGSYSDIVDNSNTYRNNGITDDKYVSNDAQYAALKDDPDWFTLSEEYCRYNHDSAVATINSLPDTSAYLATAGGTNTIVFRGSQGSKTDGGAINTLTEEEIAVAAAKGWTVTFA